jgi:hypothetical protein
MKLRYSDQIACAHYDRNEGHIYINSSLPIEDQILLAARELRRAWQHRCGALLHPLTFHPDQAILVNRAQIADLQVMMVRIAWDLQLAGEKGPWERIESSSMQDLAHAFARDAFLDFRTLNNGVAASAVFEAWFLSERCRQEDRKLIQAMLADYRGYVFDSGKSAQTVTAELIHALGSMPYGKNYLAPYVRTIMEDAVFTEVRDRSNANFLWFIKFERTFRETEQELQTTDSVTGHEAPHSPSITKKDGRIGKHEKTADIISLPHGRTGSASPPAQRRRADGANVIAFTRPGPRVRR